MKNNLLTVLLTVFGTVTSGVIVFIVGQILTTMWLYPLQKYKELKQRIAEKLSFHARYYSNVVDLAKIDEKQKEAYDSASEDLRNLSCELTGFIETLSWIKIGIPQRKDLKEAATELMGLSNSFFSSYNCTPTSEDNINNRKAANRVRKVLKLYQYEENTE